MYCPQCDLEIKGEGQKECPICNTLLIENPFADIGQQTESFNNDDLKLKELIDDIDQKVSKSLEETPADKKQGIEDYQPSESDFKLELDDDTSAGQMDNAEEQAFMLEPEDHKVSFDEDTSSKQISDPFPSLPEKAASTMAASTDNQSGREDMFESDDGMQTPGPFVSREADMPSFDVPTGSFADEPISRQGAASPPPPVEKDKPQPHDEQQMNTREILKKALDELDAVAVVEPAAAKRRPISKTIAVAALVLVVVIGGGYYLLYMQEAPVPSRPEPKVAKQEEKVLKQILKQESNKGAVADKKAEQPALQPQTAAQPAAGSGTSPSGPQKPAAVKPQAPAEKPAAKVQIAQKPSTEQKEQPSAPEQKPVVMTPPAAEQQPAVKPELSSPKVQKAAPPQQVAPAEPPQPERSQAVPAQPTSTPKAERRLTGDTFSVHAGSYQTSALAENEAQRFKRQGFNAYTEQTDLGAKGMWYRVKIGKYNSREEAKKAEAEIRSRLKGVETRVIRNK